MRTLLVYAIMVLAGVIIGTMLKLDSRQIAYVVYAICAILFLFYMQYLWGKLKKYWRKKRFKKSNREHDSEPSKGRKRSK
jgi:uncharacterized membrane protein YfcA